MRDHLTKQRIAGTALTSAKPIELPNSSVTAAAATSTPAAASASASASKALSKEERKKLIRQEGGPFAFNTKFGALNPFAIYYGLTSIVLGLAWYAALTLYQGVHVLGRGQFDKQRRIPIALNQLWGETLMFLTRCRPAMEHRDILNKFYKE
jgi:hypothetical protein